MAKEIEINLSKKQLTRRIIILVVSLVVAISTITYGIISSIKANNVDYGWASFYPTYEKNYYSYNENIYLQYYLDNSNGTSVKEKNKSITSFLDKEAKEIFSLIDQAPDHKYNEKSIGYINSHINEKIEINKRLYDILSDALEKTNNSESYSIYTGLIDLYWKELIVGNNALNQTKDPSNDEELKNELEELIELTSNKDNYSLVLENINDKYFVTLNVSEIVTSYVDQNYSNNDVTYISLNTLFYSYYIDELVKSFNEMNLIKGYFYSETGEMYFMSDVFTSNNDITIFGIVDSVKSPVGYIENKGKCAVSQIRAFSYYDYENSYTHFALYNKEYIYRSTYYDAQTGYSSNKYLNSFLIDETNSLVDTTYNNLTIMHDDKYDLIQENMYYGYILNKERDSIYLSEVDTYYKDYTNSENVLVQLNRKNIN